MTAPYHDKVIEADATVTVKTANAAIQAKTADGELGPYGDGDDPNLAWWRDAAQRPIRDADGHSIRVRIP